MMTIEIWKKIEKILLTLKNHGERIKKLEKNEVRKNEAD